MRLSNKKRLPYYQFVFTCINILLLLGVILVVLRWNGIIINLGAYSINYLFIALPILLYIGFYLRGRPIFEYDSDGEALNFRNKNFIPFLRKESRDEFPKYKLKSYEIVNARLFKRLYIKLQSKKGNTTVLKYDISYLKNKELRDLKLSLNKIVKNNTEIAQ
ncbi:hypothetical protein [Riemerella columbina]|uniref:hypothetical protein n=1 Tax=Riemerella columbina TaxID=103810 RepID=UPI00266E9EF8|nr:hypothetical protein [Riemerella columbina]WKS94452.1 hypothetical protein NYR17_05775 [Riemerella columbina]